MPAASMPHFPNLMDELKSRPHLGLVVDGASCLTPGAAGLTLRPASLLCRFMAARASCPVSRASTNCLDIASPKPTLSLQPPHSQPWPPGKKAVGRKDGLEPPGLLVLSGFGGSEVGKGSGGASALSPN